MKMRRHSVIDAGMLLFVYCYAWLVATATKLIERKQKARLRH